MAITRMAIAREIPPQAARTAPRNEAHQLSRPKFWQNRYVPKKPARNCLASSPFSAQPVGPERKSGRGLVMAVKIVQTTGMGVKIRSLLRNSLAGAGALFAASVAFSGTSHAVTFDLTSDFCGGGCGTPPFATVDVTQVGTGVHIVVDSANGPPNTVGWAQTGALSFALFAFNATGVVLGDITVVQTFAGQTLAAVGGSFGSGGPGDFVFAIGCATCGGTVRISV